MDSTDKILLVLRKRSTNTINCFNTINRIYSAGGQTTDINNNINLINTTDDINCNICVIVIDFNTIA